jgi:hypothetical protein
MRECWGEASRIHSLRYQIKLNYRFDSMVALTRRKNVVYFIEVLVGLIRSLPGIGSRVPNHVACCWFHCAVVS